MIHNNYQMNKNNKVQKNHQIYYNN